MIFWEVIVGVNIVEIWPVDEVKKVDYRAIVDGEKHVYEVKKKKYAKLRNGWFHRASQEVYYHAKSHGSHVFFENVEAQDSKRREKKIHDKQMTLI